MPAESAKEAAEIAAKLAEGPTFVELLAEEMAKRIELPGTPAASTTYTVELELTAAVREIIARGGCANVCRRR